MVKLCWKYNPPPLVLLPEIFLCALWKNSWQKSFPLRSVELVRLIIFHVMIWIRGYLDYYVSQDHCIVCAQSIDCLHSLSRSLQLCEPQLHPSSGLVCSPEYSSWCHRDEFSWILFCTRSFLSSIQAGLPSCIDSVGCLTYSNLSCTSLLILRMCPQGYAVCVPVSV